MPVWRTEMSIEEMPKKTTFAEVRNEEIVYSLLTYYESLSRIENRK